MNKIPGWGKLDCSQERNTWVTGYYPSWKSSASHSLFPCHINCYLSFLSQTWLSGTPSLILKDLHRTLLFALMIPGLVCVFKHFLHSTLVAWLLDYKSVIHCYTSAFRTVLKKREKKEKVAQWMINEWIDLCTNTQGRYFGVTYSYRRNPIFSTAATNVKVGWALIHRMNHFFPQWFFYLCDLFLFLSFCFGYW